MNAKAQNFFTHKATMFLVSFFAALAPVFFWACRSNSFIFIDKILFIGFCQVIFWLMVANAIFATVLAALRWRHSAWSMQAPKWGAVSSVVCTCLTVVFAIVNIALLIGLGEEAADMAFISAADMLPFLLAYLIAALLAFFFPAVSDKKLRVIIAVLIIAIAVFGALFAIYPPVHYKFMSDPMVLDNGSGYSVVFATSAEGNGYVEYEYEGKTYKVYDEQDGRIKGSSTIHSVQIPYEHLDNNTYRVGSMRVFEEYAYGGRNGRTIESEEYEFAPCTGEDISLLCISDWHTRTKTAKKAISHLGEYQGVILLGDAASCMQFEEQASEFLVTFGGDITGGEIPVIFARGNHETRGEYATELSDALGMDSFYYETTHFGDYRFIVLDSAEDKADDHVEYGGSADYTAYRTRMTEWLDGLEASGEKTLIVCHSPEISREKDLAERAFVKMEELGAPLVLAGHYHYCALKEKEWPLLTYIDGGHGGGDFTASLVTLSGDGIGLKACNKSGEEVLNKLVGWDGTVLK